MISVSDHYRDLLGHHYHHLAPTLNDALVGLEALGLPKAPRGADWLGVDLGCGTGVYTEALRTLGYDAAGVDTCQVLIDKARTAYPSCYFAEQDLQRYRPRQPLRACLLLGDTINHLPSLGSIDALVKALAPQFETGGMWLTTFRSYGRPEGAKRFVDVVANEHLTMSCFIERDGDYVLTTDLVRAKADGWRLQTGRYRKLVVQPQMLREVFASRGFATEVATTKAGLTAVIATKRAPAC